MHISLTQRLTIAVSLFGALLLLTLGGLTYLRAREALRRSTEAELQAIATEKAAALDRWRTERLADITQLAASPTLRAAAERLAAAPDAPADTALQAELAAHIGGDSFADLLILAAADGRLLAASAGAAAVGPDDLAALAGGQSALIVATPLPAADGRPAAVLIGRSALGALGGIMQRRTSHFQSLDIFLVNPERAIVTQPYFLPAGDLLASRLDTAAINRCIGERQSSTLLAPDYRGVMAVISHSWLAADQLCMIAKVDRAEAFAPADALGAEFAGLGGLILLGGVAFALAFARGISRPLLDLRAGVERLAGGAEPGALPEGRRDEIGALARDFRQMAATIGAQGARLREQAAGLERLVAERTAALRASEEQLRITFEQAAVGIAQVAPDGRFLSLNPRFCAIIGYPPEEALALDFQRITHPDDLGSDLELLGQLLRGEIPFYTLEKRYLRRDGGLVWVNLTVSLIRDAAGQPLHFVSVIEEIGARKRVEAELAHSNAELARSNAELERFAYVASHDLQEPLRMVSSYTQLLARRYRGQLDADADEFIAYAVDGASRMQRLINDLLAYSRVGTRGKPLRPTDCGAVVRQVLADLQLAIAEAGAEVGVGELPTLPADAVQLGQLFQNLVGNALKFRSAEQPPRITIGAERAGGDWSFRVADNGIGIDPAYFERIFIIFQRLHQRDEYPGTGIGLAICKKIVERHGGRIWVESAPGAGTAFCFTLPAEHPHDHPPDRDPAG